MRNGTAFISICVTLLFSFVFLSGAEPLTLAQCLEFARENSPDLIQARIAIERAHLGVISAESRNYPEIRVSTGASRFGNESRSNNSYSSNLILNYSIFRGGYDKANIEIARLNEKISKENYRANEQQVFLSIKEVFYKILQKEEQLKLIGRILERRRADHILIKLKYQSGRESAPAVKEAELNVINAEYDSISAESELRLARMELNLLLGRPKDAELIITHEDEEFELLPVEALIETAKVSRPEKIIELLNYEIKKQLLAQAKSEYAPEVALSFSYGWAGNKFFDQSRAWSIGANLSLNLFDGFLRQTKVKDSKSAILQEEFKLKSVDQQIVNDVESAYSNLVLAKKKFEIAQKSVEVAREVYELTKLQYEEGITSYFFLQQKESELTQAEYSNINALYNLRLTGARLQNAIGK